MQVVNLQTTLGTLASNQLTTGAEGKATTQLTSTTEGTATVTASCSGLSATCTVTFTAPSNPSTIEVAANPTSLPADGHSTSTITVQVAIDGQPAPDGTAFTLTTTWQWWLESCRHFQEIHQGDLDHSGHPERCHKLRVYVAWRDPMTGEIKRVMTDEADRAVDQRLRVEMRNPGCGLLT